MNSLSNWLDPEELNSLPDSLRFKLNFRIQESIQSISAIQNEYSQSALAYENTISMLNKNLQEQNQKYYELEMNALKMKTRKDQRENREVETNKDSRRITKVSRNIQILKKKISSLILQNQELENKNQSLNSQIEFILQNKDVESQEVCLLAATYVSELNEIKEKLANQTSIRNLKTELEVLRSNEKEYQAHVYASTRELYDLQNKINTLETQNSLLLQYKLKFENLHSEYLKISTTLNELKLKNFELKSILKSNNDKSEIMNAVDQIRAIQIETFKVFQSSISSDRNLSFEIDSFIFPIKQDIDSLLTFVNKMILTKNEIMRLFSILLELTDRKIENDNSNSIKNLEPDVQLLKQENDILNAKLLARIPDNQLLSEIESINSQNENLRNEIERFKNQLTELLELNGTLSKDCENLKVSEQNLKSVLEDMKNSNVELKKNNKVLKKDNLENNHRIEDLQDKIVKLENEIIKIEEERYSDFYKREKSNLEDENYIRNLEEQLESYKKDVKSIESQFTEYRKLYDSFNIDSTNEKISVMKTNIERKDLLIESLYTLVNRYRKVSDVLMNKN